MTNRVLRVGAGVDDLHERRLAAIAAAGDRLGALTGPRDAGAGTLVADLLRGLAAAGRIAVSTGDGSEAGEAGGAGGAGSEESGPWTLSYVPSAEALAAVTDGTSPSWGARVDSKQRKAVRRARGAVLRLPFADPATGEATGGALSTFTTDWSPFTAACAAVVHPDHEALAGTRVRPRPYYSGLSVRHPLHGDLLPLWVADWAKPEFGTGAVIVNPAHSAADLEFAREVGLPIRFGLGAHEPTADPESWLTPPVIKSGVAVRAGHHDGLSHEETVRAYLAELSAAGNGEPADSLSLGRVPLAVLRQDAAGELRWVPALRARSLTELAADAPADDAVSVAVEAAPLLSALARYTQGEALLVASSEAVADDLLWLRLLALDAGVEHAPSEVLPVARIGSAQGVDPQWLDGALLVAGRPEDTVSVKAQVGEQVARIAGDHAAAVAAAGEPEPAASKAAVKIATALAAADFAAAFSASTAVGKAVRRGGAVPESERVAFLGALHVLFGLPLPEGFPTEVLEGLLAL